MAVFNTFIKGLRTTERELENQLTKVRNAIASLQVGRGAAGAKSSTPGTRKRRKRRKMSAAGRAKIAAAQKKRWATVKAGQKK